MMTLCTHTKNRALFAQDVMVKSIDAVLSRGERIEILVDRTGEMSQQARQFRKRSTVLRRKMWWKNVKVLIAIGFSAFVRSSLYLCKSFRRFTDSDFPLIISCSCICSRRQRVD